MKKILLTGATGLIGKEVLPLLIKKNYDIYSISTKDIKSDNVHWIKCDIFDIDILKSVFDKYKPDYLLHFAWITGGDYLTNEKNILYKNSSEKMLEFFKQNNGKKAIYSGSCFEYKFSGEILKESNELESNNLYEKSKNELHDFCMNYSKNNDLNFGWGRIFYVFGHNEKQSRLTPLIMEKIKNNEEFYLSKPNNCLDYMYSKDIAKAFVEFLESDCVGDVNICSGKGVYLKDYALMIQKIMNKKDLIKYDETMPEELNIIGDNTILKEKIGFRPEYDLYSGLKEVILNYKN